MTVPPTATLVVDMADVANIPNGFCGQVHLYANVSPDGYVAFCVTPWRLPQRATA